MKFVIILLTVLSFISCKDIENNSEQKVTEETSEERMPDKAHNSQNSLDWAGVYTGVLPCEDCEGIETKIRLSYDLNYTLSQFYLGTTNRDSVTEKGKFEWNKQENTVSLGEREKLHFKVSENYLLQVFEDESKVMGDSAIKYRLTKTNTL